HDAAHGVDGDLLDCAVDGRGERLVGGASARRSPVPPRGSAPFDWISMAGLETACTPTHLSSIERSERPTCVRPRHAAGQGKEGGGKVKFCETNPIWPRGVMIEALSRRSSALTEKSKSTNRSQLSEWKQRRAPQQSQFQRGQSQFRAGPRAERPRLGSPAVVPPSRRRPSAGRLREWLDLVELGADH